MKFRYEKLGRLGEGTEGHIFLIRRIGIGTEKGKEFLALKKTNHDCGEEVRRLHEVQKGSSLEGRENVVKCLHQLSCKEFVMNYTGNVPYEATMDLYNYIEQNGRVQDEQLKLVITDMLRGVRAMHAASVIHMDLKPENMMVSLVGGKIVMLTIVDLGFAKNDKEKLQRACGTQRYAAPELMMAPFDLSASKALDLWAAGVTLMVVDKCRFPFEVADPSACEVFNGMFSVPYEERFGGYSTVIVPHLRMMMRLDPAKRTLLL